MQRRSLAIGLTLAVAGWAGAQSAPARKVIINARTIGAEEQAELEKIEKRYRFRLPDGSYWYDRISGAVGLWKGPAAGFIPAGLHLGPKMPQDCSGGGTGVFVNGRELHPIDVAALRQFTVVLPGRWWVDAQGNGGPENGPAMFNLVVLAQQAAARGARSSGWSRRAEYGGSNLSVGGDGNFLYFMDSKGNSAYVGN